MASVSSLFYAAPTPAAQVEKPAKTDDDSPSCCTRITNVFKCIISWIVYIFTCGIVTVFDDEKKPAKMSAEELILQKKEDDELVLKINEMEKKTTPVSDYLELILQINSPEQRDKALEDLILGNVLEDADKIEHHLDSCLDAIVDNGKREALCSTILNKFCLPYCPPTCIYRNEPLLRVFFSVVLGKISDPKIRSKAIAASLDTKQYNSIKTLNELKDLILTIPVEYIDSRITAIDGIINYANYHLVGNDETLILAVSNLFEIADWVEGLKSTDPDHSVRYEAERKAIYTYIYSICLLEDEGRARMSKEQVLEIAAKIPPTYKTTKFVRGEGMSVVSIVDMIKEFAETIPPAESD